MVETLSLGGDPDREVRIVSCVLQLALGPVEPLVACHLGLCNSRKTLTGHFLPLPLDASPHASEPLPARADGKTSAPAKHLPSAPVLDHCARKVRPFSIQAPTSTPQPCANCRSENLDFRPRTLFRCQPNDFQAPCQAPAKHLPSAPIFLPSAPDQSTTMWENTTNGNQFFRPSTLFIILKEGRESRVEAGGGGQRHTFIEF